MPLTNCWRSYCGTGCFTRFLGGGVTLSGGEPTLFSDYGAEILGRLKEQGIHTALQTNGCFLWGEFRQKLLPQVDLVMMDLKLAEGKKHREYTGQDKSR